ncbi:MAG TPA: DUF3570 domain-containing protein, partial [Polyangium sp.]|nr:DUF3570 domain-containing protein [Polyangium sp.]
HTFISTTAVSGSFSPIDVLSFRGRYIADVVTSASVDVVTAATGAFDELRHEGLGSVAYRDGTRTASATYVYSTEHDWSSHSISGSYSQDFFAHQVTVGLGGGFTANDVGRSGDPNFHRSLLQGSASITLGLVATKRDLINVDYTFVYLNGYQASPYRFVRIMDPSVTIPGIYVASPEAPPEQRARHALAARWNHAVGTDSALKSHIRGYTDDWGVRSVTAGTEFVLGLGNFDLGIFVRGYAQSKVAFYQPVYDRPRKYMTSDRELATFVDGFGGLRVAFGKTVGPFKELRAEAKATGFAFHFFDFPRLVNRFGVIGEIAIGATL